MQTKWLNASEQQSQWSEQPEGESLCVYFGVLVHGDRSNQHMDLISSTTYRLPGMADLRSRISPLWLL